MSSYCAGMNIKLFRIKLTRLRNYFLIKNNLADIINQLIYIMIKNGRDKMRKFFSVLKWIIFYLMFYLRPLVFRLRNFMRAVYFLCMFGGLVFYLRSKQKIYGFVGIFSLICEIGSFVFLDFYDRILLKLNPTGRELILYRKN